MPNSNALDFDSTLLSPEYLANPYRYYSLLRQTNPVHWSDRLNAWVLTRYEDVRHALKDPRLISSRRVSSYAHSLPQQTQVKMQPLFYQFEKWIGNMDPPDHTRLRRLVNVAFTARMVENLRDDISQLVHELLDSVEAHSHLDFVRDFAYPLPAIVIARMLGVPSECSAQFMKWSDDLTAYSGTGQADPEIATAASRSASELTRLFKELADARRAHPQKDLLSRLVEAEEEGDRLNEQELLGMCGFLIVAGHETTMALLANGMLALLRHPDQQQQLRNNPQLITTAVEEILRFDSPIQHQTRSADEDLEIAGTKITKGDRVLPILGAANRDPAKFREPDQLDLAREPNPHLAFGWGPHFCLGAPLARLEAQIAVPAILERWPSIQLANHEPKFRHHTSQRNPIRLELKI
ncbi:MAG: cytochrome P450 [Pirellulaceae bacterium]|nr:cytochrome P450 [Pirellulaceae bacterium]